MKKVKIYIVDYEEQDIRRLENVCYEHPELHMEICGYSYSYEGCLQDKIRTKSADLFLISASLPDTMGYKLTPNIKSVNKKAKVVVMLTPNTLNLMEEAKENGADGILRKPFKIHQITEFVEEIRGANGVEEAEEEEEKPRDYNFGGVNTKTVSKRKTFENEFENTIMTLDTESEIKPKISCFFYATSSAGRTSLLTNVAHIISKFSKYKPKICLLDFNMLYPGITYHFDDHDLIEKKRDIYQICENPDYLDEESIREALIHHEPSDIYILKTPRKELRDPNIISLEVAEYLILKIKEMFDLVLIDASSNFRENLTLASLKTADMGVVVVEPSLTSIVHTQKFISFVEWMDKNEKENLKPKLKFVLNKDNPKIGIGLKEVKRTLEVDVDLRIPEDYNITFLSTNALFVTEKETPSQKYIIELAKMIYPFEKEYNFQKPNNQKGSISNLFKFLKK